MTIDLLNVADKAIKALSPIESDKLTNADRYFVLQQLQNWLSARMEDLQAKLIEHNLTSDEPCQTNDGTAAYQLKKATRFVFPQEAYQKLEEWGVSSYFTEPAKVKLNKTALSKAVKDKALSEKQQAELIMMAEEEPSFRLEMKVLKSAI